MVKPLLSNTIHLYNNLKFGAVDNQLIPRTDIYIIIFWCVCLCVCAISRQTFRKQYLRVTWKL